VITTSKVEEIFRDCLWRDDDDGERLEIEGIVHTMIFEAHRLESHRDEVKHMLSELPNEFRDSAEGGGGGWTFLNACNDRNGHQWGEHLYMEQLMTMGIGLGLVYYLLPRELWPSLPGSMPYFTVVLGETV